MNDHITPADRIYILPEEQGTKDRRLEITEQALVESIVAVLLDYFSDARVTGIEIRKSDSRLIALSVLDHLGSQDDRG